MARKLNPSVLVPVSVAVLVALIFAVFAVLAVQGYGTNLDRASDKAQTSADVVLEETRWLVGASLRALSGVQLALGGDPAKLTGDLQQTLDQEIALLPAKMNLLVYDAEGQIQGAPPQDIPASLADAPLFARLQQGPEWLISPGGAELNISRAAFVVARRLELGGRFSGMALLIINVDVLKNFWEPLMLGPEATVNMLRDDGWLVARFPALDAPLNISDRDTFTDHLSKSDSGTYITKSPIDGVSRIVAFRHLPEYGLIATASISLGETLGSFWYGVGVVLLLLVPVSVALTAGSLWTSRILNQLEMTLEQNQVLFREIHHRVKNNLQSVSALIQMQRIDPEVRRNTANRIAAMSAVHEHLYRSNKFDAVLANGYLNAIIDSMRDSQDPDVDLVSDIDPIEVDKDAATPLGLIVNEVLTNAYKYAFADGRSPKRIAISLKSPDPKTVELRIVDNGVGFNAAQAKAGMGSRLVDALARQLQGEAEYAADNGTAFILSFPMKLRSPAG